MNIKALIPLILSLVLGLIAAVVGWQMTQQPPREATGPAGVELVVVKADVAPGTEMMAEHLAMARSGASSAPEGTFTEIEQVIGRVPVAPLRRGQAVYDTLLAAPGSGRGLQALVPSGMRAITMEINEFSGVGHLLVPGSRVDVVVTMPVEDGQGIMTRTVCQDLKVTAVGQQLSAARKDEEGQAPRSVTLLATPRDVQLIELASSTGRPRLVLRANGDDARTNMPGVTLAELRGHSARPARSSVRPVAQTEPTTRPDEPTYRTVQIIRAGNESTVTFETSAQGAMTRLPIEP